MDKPKLLPITKSNPYRGMLVIKLLGGWTRTSGIRLNPVANLWDLDLNQDHCINSAGFYQLNYPRELLRGKQ